MRRVIKGLASLLAIALMLSLMVGCGSDSDSTSSDTTPASTPAASPADEGSSAEQDAPVELPAAPADVSGMSAWFAEAYPDAAWRSRIKSIEYVAGEVPDSGGFNNAIVVTTDLDYATEQAVAEEISAALGEAHLTWAKQSVIWFADGNNMLAGDMWDRTP